MINYNTTVDYEFKSLKIPLYKKMGFFINSQDPDAKLSGSQRKRQYAAMKVADRQSVQSKSKKHAKKHGKDDEEGDEDDFDQNAIDDMNLMESDHSGSDDGEDETAAQKRLRLAKSYLSKLKENVRPVSNNEIDAEAMDQDLIAERLRNDAVSRYEFIHSLDWLY